MPATEELQALIAHKLRFVVQKPNVLCLEHITPICLNSLPIFASLAQKLGLSLASEIVETNEHMLLIACFSGKSLPESMAFVPQILALPFLQAHEKNQAYLLSGEWFLKADTLLQLECLAEITYPQFFNFGYEGTAWVRINA